jgi:hypothetical protein
MSSDFLPEDTDEKVAAENRGLAETIIVMETYMNDVAENKDEIALVINRLRTRFDFTANVLKERERLGFSVKSFPVKEEVKID